MKNLTPLVLSPIRSPLRSYEFVAFDTEGDGSAHGFKLACAWDDQGGHTFKKKRDLRVYLFSHARREKRILAANLEYDWSVAFQPFDCHHSILVDAGRWLRATYTDNNHHCFTAWDLQRIAPLSVADMGRVLGLPKYPTPVELTGKSIEPAEHFTCDTHHRTDCVECYCLRDAQIVYEFAVLYQRELNDLGGQFKMTAASCSMDLFKRRFLDDEIEPTWEKTNDFARGALYGGRVEPFKVGTDNFVNAYDFNSLYPSVMRDLEIGRPGTYHHLYHTDRLTSRLDGFGIFRGELEIPKFYAPPLPVKVRGHNYFVTGRVKGAWMFSEVRHALELGAVVKSTDEIVFARETFHPFREFVDVLYARKQIYSSTRDPRLAVVKLLLNSLWGKFAQRTDGGLMTLITPRGKFKLSDYAHGEVVEIAGREAILKPLDDTIQSPHIHVPWAAEISARARIRLHVAMTEADESLFYCDTDSIHTDKILRVGSELGELKLVDRFQRVTYLAPKEYGGLNTRGEFVGHAKGIPRELCEDFLRDGHVRFKRPSHLREAIRAGERVATWKLVYKERRQNPPVRDHPPLDDYNTFWVDTRPYDAEGVPEAYD